MAYNLQSLITVVEKILNPQQTRWIVDHNKPRLESLLQKAASLQQNLEKFPLTKIGSLESQIRDSAHKAEDIIESHMVDQMLASRGGVSFTFSTPDLQQVTQELDSAMEQVVEFMKGKTTSSGTPSSGASFLSSKSILVGVDEDLFQLKDRLTGEQRKLEIVPIVGMGGVGKTTLARKLYEDELIISHFEYRGWTTISQDYNMRGILLGLLRCIIGDGVDRLNDKEINELKDILYKSLYGRKYLIVLDDMWSISSWEEIRRGFPDNNNRSRIVITTRESDVATHADSRSQQHQVQLLSESESWTLIRQIVFGEEDCPHFLQGIGERIASDCGGLPLAINVIGGLLSKVERSKDVWENIGNDVRTTIVEADEQFSNILSLSYNQLPNHLKPCFLYMGAFPEDSEIKSSRLVRLWVAEGFVKSKGDKIMEEEAEDYLKSLVERNLLLVKNEKLNGKPKIYGMHDLLRDLCMRICDEDKFLHVNNSTNLIPFCNSRRLSMNVPTSYVNNGMKDMYASTELMSLARSFLSTNSNILISFFSALRFLRVLDIRSRRFESFPTEILQLVNLRYLAIGSLLPCGISRLCNLQTLIALRGFRPVPFEIWELPELRQLDLNAAIWSEDEWMKRIVVQQQLQIISQIGVNDRLIEIGFFESIPNIRKLGLYIVIPPSSAVDLSHLHQLETLRCECSYGGGGRGFLSMLKFPSTLRKLTLSKFETYARVLRVLCELPNLEVLKIYSCYFERNENDEEWDVAEGDEFRSLQFLSLSFLNLKRWSADETNFPRLRCLHLDSCNRLEEIPTGIGEIPTLQLIELQRCSDSAVASAKQIVELQHTLYDNYTLYFL